ncbi:cytosolic 5'-nucleotidase 1A isoform X1 [Pristis pectinata]|uniref:cytosolic 5'-nucleotidase 1A isoform X1 n=1 Tax=Pristis pectinata TaxID=685728 RepID=UPI00223D3257|nr:cytosolic 5'-nucleotidase 1A isoform X1 [Pristis pectinata]XP_051885560.1 cytosolic 5'-nucleotidase 1A isoform X1 [Pristis pectinata]XP_051885561.1 cytosolic 5'-nucleotidase 1A isoform X1 [Pristis pectinata]
MDDNIEVILNTEVKQKDPIKAVTIAISARALFDMEEEHELFLTEGPEEYINYQISNEDIPLKEGIVLPFIRAVNMVNKKLLKLNPEEKQLFEILLLSTHSAEGGVRIINSVNYYGLDISKFCFLNGKDPSKYLKSQNVMLFLSACETSVCNALKRNIPAALMLQQECATAKEQLKVAFDGDSVLFSDETDNVFREKGLEEVIKYEKNLEHVPIGEGPFKMFAMILGEMKKKFSPEDDPICTYLVTARSGNDLGIRAIKTLREWGLKIDEAFFMAGAPKGPILSQIQPHIFFDDNIGNINGAREFGIPAGLVLAGCK